MQDFTQLLVKSYKFWEIYVHENQRYLGRCIVWCKRDDALDLPYATREEQQELFEVLRDLDQALQVCFQPDLLNFAFLGNETHHLHCHVIPRYKKIRKFMELTFRDSRFGQSYRTNHRYAYSTHLLQNVRGLLKKAIERR